MTCLIGQTPEVDVAAQGATHQKTWKAAVEEHMDTNSVEWNRGDVPGGKGGIRSRSCGPTKIAERLYHDLSGSRYIYCK